MRTVRRPAANALLAAFVLAAQVAPVAHLATHRPDHRHGPGPARHGERSAAAHETGHATAHEAHEAAHATGTPHRHPAGHHDDATPRQAPDDDHGAGAVAHFGLAVLEGPPPPFVPAPGETIAASADMIVPGHDAPDSRAPTARGPPA